MKQTSCQHGELENGVCKCDADYYGGTCDVHCDWQETCHKHGVCNAWSEDRGDDG